MGCNKILNLFPSTRKLHELLTTAILAASIAHVVVSIEVPIILVTALTNPIIPVIGVVSEMSHYLYFFDVGFLVHSWNGRAYALPLIVLLTLSWRSHGLHRTSAGSSACRFRTRF